MLRRRNISQGPCLKHMGLALGPTKKDTRLLICLHVSIHFSGFTGQINTLMKRHKKVLKRTKLSLCVHKNGPKCRTVCICSRTKFSLPNAGMVICNFNQFGEQQNLKTMLRAR